MVRHGRHFEIKSVPIGQPMEKPLTRDESSGRDKRVGPYKKSGQKKPKYGVVEEQYRSIVDKSAAIGAKTPGSAHGEPRRRYGDPRAKTGGTSASGGRCGGSVRRREREWRERIADPSPSVELLDRKSVGYEI